MVLIVVGIHGLTPARVHDISPLTVVQVLKKDLERLAVSTQDAGLMEPVKL